MKRFLYAFLLLLFLSASFLAGSWYSKREDVSGSGSAGDPFPQREGTVEGSPTPDKRDQETSPSKTEPADNDSAGEDSGEMGSMPLGTVKIGPERQQMVGIRVAQVEKKPLRHVIRAFGRVAADETRVYRLIAPLDGWILETFDNATGSLVKKDERLASFYSLDVLTAQQNYLSALSTITRLRDEKTGPPPGEQSNVARTRATYMKRTLDGLRSIGMSEVQIKEFERTQQYAENIDIVAPAESFILLRNVSPGQRFDKGTEWYRLADLSHVWILADLFENESQYIKPGAWVRITLPHQRKAFQAKVSKILPQFDAASRTLKVRLEMDNPDFILKPDMFVDVEFPISIPPAVFVPADAVLDSGLRKTIFIDRGNGFFEPRRVETGWRIGDRVEIVSGLQTGERIVVSGNFLIDSESRMELAAAGIYGMLSKDPVCGMETDEKKAAASGMTSSYRGTIYYFCSKECKEEFDKDPNRYIRKVSKNPMPPAQAVRSNHSKDAGESHD
jgi:RND family efflux transporter MFP subunit